MADSLTAIIMDGGRVEISRWKDTEEMDVIVSFGDRRLGIRLRQHDDFMAALSTAVWWRKEDLARQAA